MAFTCKAFRSDLKKLMCKLILFLPFRKLQRLVGDLEDYAYNAHERERKQSEGGEVRNAEEEFPDGQQQADVAVELITFSVHIKPLFRFVLSLVYLLAGSSFCNVRFDSPNPA